MYSKFIRRLATTNRLMNKNKAVFIVGTTGVGKTKLSIELAHRFNGEIINADAMQMYHGLNIATAKATVEEREGVPHHLLDYVDPRSEVTVHDFHDKAIDDLNKEGKLPIIVGGTHYYIQSLIWDSLLDVTESKEDQETGDDSLESKSNDELYAMLQKVDPNHPHHPNQRKRILSDLRLYNQTGIAPSILRKEHNEKQSKEEQLDNLVIWLSCETEVLHKRLDSRVDKMLQAGLLKENCSFVKQYIEGSDINRGVWQAIGLKEFMPLFVNEKGDYTVCDNVNESDDRVKKMIDKVKVDTQQYAKRQITWIRNRLQSRVQHMIQLDTSQLDQWNAAVSIPAENVVQHLIDGTLPSVQVDSSKWEEQSEIRNKKYHCPVCNKIIVGEDQWKSHIKGRVHKRHIESQKRKQATQEYFKEKERKEKGEV